MHRFWKGLIWGLLVGGFLAWLWQKRVCSIPQTVPARPGLLEEPPRDDLTALRGIGPIFAQRLYQGGITTYRQLAHLSPEEAATCCQIPVQRVRQDDWVGQAAERVR